MNSTQNKSSADEKDIYEYLNTFTLDELINYIKQEPRLLKQITKKITPFLVFLSKTTKPQLIDKIFTLTDKDHYNLMYYIATSNLSNTFLLEKIVKMLTPSVFYQEITQKVGNETPLMIAVEKSNPVLLKFLVTHFNSEKLRRGLLYPDKQSITKLNLTFEKYSYLYRLLSPKDQKNHKIILFYLKIQKAFDTENERLIEFCLNELSQWSSTEQEELLSINNKAYPSLIKHLITSSSSSLNELVHQFLNVLNTSVLDNCLAHKHYDHGAPISILSITARQKNRLFETMLLKASSATINKALALSIKGATPTLLHYAFYMQSDEIFKLLIQKADPKLIQQSLSRDDNYEWNELGFDFYHARYFIHSTQVKNALELELKTLKQYIIRELKVKNSTSLDSLVEEILNYKPSEQGCILDDDLLEKIIKICKPETTAKLILGCEETITNTTKTNMLLHHAIESNSDVIIDSVLEYKPKHLNKMLTTENIFQENSLHFLAKCKYKNKQIINKLFTQVTPETLKTALLQRDMYSSTPLLKAILYSNFDLANSIIENSDKTKITDLLNYKEPADLRKFGFSFSNQIEFTIQLLPLHDQILIRIISKELIRESNHEVLKKLFDSSYLQATEFEKILLKKTDNYINLLSYIICLYPSDIIEETFKVISTEFLITMLTDLFKENKKEFWSKAFPLVMKKVPPKDLVLEIIKAHNNDINVLFQVAQHQRAIIETLSNIIPYETVKVLLKTNEPLEHKSALDTCYRSLSMTQHKLLNSMLHGEDKLRQHVKMLQALTLQLHQSNESKKETCKEIAELKENQLEQVISYKPKHFDNNTNILDHIIVTYDASDAMAVLSRCTDAQINKYLRWEFAIKYLPENSLVTLAKRVPAKNLEFALLNLSESFIIPTLKDLCIILKLCPAPDIDIYEKILSLLLKTFDIAKATSVKSTHFENLNSFMDACVLHYPELCNKLLGSCEEIKYFVQFLNDISVKEPYKLYAQTLFTVWSKMILVRDFEYIGQVIKLTKNLAEKEQHDLLGKIINHDNALSWIFFACNSKDVFKFLSFCHPKAISNNLFFLGIDNMTALHKLAYYKKTEPFSYLLDIASDQSVDLACKHVKKHNMLHIAISRQTPADIAKLIHKIKDSTLKLLLGEDEIPQQIIDVITMMMIIEPAWQDERLVERLLTIIGSRLIESLYTAWLNGACFQNTIFNLMTKLCNDDTLQVLITPLKNQLNSTPTRINTACGTVIDLKSMPDELQLTKTIWEEGLASIHDFRGLMQAKILSAKFLVPLRNLLNEDRLIRYLPDQIVGTVIPLEEELKFEKHTDSIDSILKTIQKVKMASKMIRDEHWDDFTKQLDYKYRADLRAKEDKSQFTHKFHHLSGEIIKFIHHIEKKKEYKNTIKSPVTLLSSKHQRSMFGEFWGHPLVGVLFSLDNLQENDVQIKALLLRDRGTYARGWVGTLENVKIYAADIAEFNYLDFDKFCKDTEKEPTVMNELLVKLSKKCIRAIFIGNDSVEAREIALKRLENLKSIDPLLDVPILIYDRANCSMQLYSQREINRDLNEVKQTISSRDSEIREIILNKYLEKWDSLYNKLPAHVSKTSLNIKEQNFSYFNSFMLHDYFKRIVILIHLIKSSSQKVEHEIELEFYLNHILSWKPVYLRQILQKTIVNTNWTLLTCILSHANLLNKQTLLRVIQKISECNLSDELMGHNKDGNTFLHTLLTEDNFEKGMQLMPLFEANLLGKMLLAKDSVGMSCLSKITNRLNKDEFENFAKSLSREFMDHIVTLGLFAFNLSLKQYEMICTVFFAVAEKQLTSQRQPSPQSTTSLVAKSLSLDHVETKESKSKYMRVIEPYVQDLYALALGKHSFLEKSSHLEIIKEISTWDILNQLKILQMNHHKCYLLHHYIATDYADGLIHHLAPAVLNKVVFLEDESHWNSLHYAAHLSRNRTFGLLLENLSVDDFNAKLDGTLLRLVITKLTPALIHQVFKLISVENMDKLLFDKGLDKHSVLQYALKHLKGDLLVQFKNKISLNMQHKIGSSSYSDLQLSKKEWNMCIELLKEVKPESHSGCLVM